MHVKENIKKAIKINSKNECKSFIFSFAAFSFLMKMFKNMRIMNTNKSTGLNITVKYKV